MKRSDGAKTWSTVLSELAQVRVSVEWERPTWLVSWQNGPSLEALMGRAAALGGYRLGAPLPFDDLRFARSNSGMAVALAWLVRGSPESPAAARAVIADVGVLVRNVSPDPNAMGQSLGVFSVSRLRMSSLISP